MSKPKESREYVIRGPFAVDIERPKKYWRKLPDNIIDKFFAPTRCEKYKTKIGVYIFARKHGDSYTPIYIGKSTNSFFAEVFNPSNRLTYNDAIMEMNGSFVIFLILPIDVDNDDSWASNYKEVTHRRSCEIDDIETYFIYRASKVCSCLKNKQKRRVSEWYINDVIRGSKTKGRKSSPLKEFRKMMGFK